MRPLRIHSLVSSLACLVGVATCLVACGGNGGSFGGHGGTSNVNYKFSANQVTCNTSFVITKNIGTFPSGETVNLQGLSGTVAATVSLSTDSTELTVTFPDTAPSGIFNVDLSDDGKIGTIGYTGCSN